MLTLFRIATGDNWNGILEVRKQKKVYDLWVNNKLMSVDTSETLWFLNFASDIFVPLQDLSLDALKVPTYNEDVN